MITMSNTSPSIVTVTLNPALDRTLSVPQLLPGAMNRARLVRQDWGGKGINVSRALRALGVTSRISGLIGGVTGELLKNRLTAEGFEVSFVSVSGETRQNITLRDDASGLYTKLNEPGPTISGQDEASVAAFIEQTARPGDIWVFSGSLPAGASPDLYARLIGSVQERNAQAILDTSGAALRLGTAARPMVIKPNSEEAAEALGVALDDDEAHAAAALALHTRGVRYVLLTRGAQGALLAGDGEVCRATPPQIDALSSVGAGDASLAGLLWGLVEGYSLADMARCAVACGAAAALQEGTGIGSRALVDDIYERVSVARGV